MKAIVHEGKEGLAGLKVKPMEEKEPAGFEVKVRIHTAGMNRRDLAVASKRHKAEDPAVILGSDAAGVVEETGSEVTRFKKGDEVIINPGLGWKENSDVPPEGFEIVGFPGHGTFAETYISTEDHLEMKPKHLSMEEAGVLALAALTAYRALFTRGRAKEGDTVMLPGIGGGVLTYALKFAKAEGARVIVTSRSSEKLKQALDAGADKAILTDSDWSEELADERIDLLIESIGAATFHQSLRTVRKGGTIVTFGSSTEDEVSLNLREFFYGQYNLLGSTMGSAEELRAMLAFIERHNIHPEVDRMFSIEQAAEAFEYIRDTKNFGKIGFQMS